MRQKIDWKKYHGTHREQRNQYVKDWCKRNPEKRFGRYWRTRLKRYGMTPADYQAMLEAQDGKCLICQNTMDVPTPEKRVRHGRSATIDHDHVRKSVRAILCNNCNRAIGLLGDNVATLRNAIVYLDIFAND